MPQILLCNQAVSSAHLQRECGLSTDNVMDVGCSRHATLQPYRPYLLSQSPSGNDIGILAQLYQAPISANLTHLALSFGEDNTVAIAEIMQKLRGYNIGVIGASTSVYARRMESFGQSVTKYQQALLNYREAVKTKSGNRYIAKQRAHTAFHQMQVGFQNELRLVTAVTSARARRGTPLTSPGRGVNIAASSRNVARLNVADQVQASRLVRYSQHARFLGNGIAVIDFGGRIGSVTNAFQSGSQWEREMFVESTSFAVSTVAGAVTIKAGSAALGFIVVLTPVGWAGLLVGGAVVAGAAAAASVGTNAAVKSGSGGVYDQIMGWLQR